MLNLKTLAIDSEASEDGRWVTYPGTPAKFLIRRFNSEVAEKLRTEMIIENHDELTGEDNEAGQAIGEKIDLEVLVRTILAGWEGVGDEIDGEVVEVPYTYETGLKYLGDPAYRDLRRFVERYSMNSANYRAKQVESAAKSVKGTAAS